MKPKYTTEALRKELRAAIPENLYISNLVLDNLVRVFTAQQQALLDEVKKRLPEKENEILRGKDTGFARIGSTAYAHNKTTDQVTEILEAIRKELV